MNTSNLQTVRRAPVVAVLVFLATVMIGSVALPTSPASASGIHQLIVTGSIDIKDDDVGADDWCRDLRFSQPRELDHEDVRYGQARANVRCDEVRIEVVAEGELQDDDRICNVVMTVNLYEGRSGGAIEDLDGRAQWRGGSTTCLYPGEANAFYWSQVQVDNTAEPRSNDHGWVNNLRIINQPG